MKKLALMISTLMLSASIFASETPESDGTHFRAGSDNAISQLCMAALESKEALREQAKKLKMTRKEVQRVECNDMRIHDFARNYRGVIDESSIANIQ